MKKLVIFDMDGTLIDSALDIATAVAHAATLVCELPPDTATVEQALSLVGKDLDITFKQVLPTEHHTRIPECVAAYRTYYLTHFDVTTTVFPGLLDLLTELRAAGVRLAIATTKIQPTVDRVAERLGLTPYFDLIQGVDGFPSKPDPSILRVVMKKLDCQPSDALMVGDTDNDVLCAQAAGVPICAITWGGWSAAQLAALSPDYMASHVDELRAIINNL